MLVQTLHGILRGLSSALGATAGGPVQAGRILQFQDREFVFPLAVAAHYAAGPLRRLVLGCEPGLGRAVAARLDPAGAPVPEARAAERGLELIGTALRAALCQELERGPDLEDFLVRSAAVFGADAGTTRNFCLELRTGAGRLQLLLDLDPPGRAGADAGDAADGAPVPESGTTDPEEASHLVAELVRSERHVQLLIPSAGPEPALWQGIVLGSMRPPAPPGLILTSACLGDPDRTPAVGEPLTVVFSSERRLLQFDTVLQGANVLRLPAGAALPLLQVAPPERIVPGQRRRSPRVVPQDRVEGTIRSLRPGLNEAGIRCVVRDLGGGGARVALTAPGILSAFRWGTEVACRFELPGQSRPLELAGCIRRVDLSHSGVDLSHAELAVEFDATRPENDEPLRRLRSYVAGMEPAEVGT